LIPHHEIYTVPSAMIPGLLDYLDYPDIATLAMPRPLLVVHGQRDTLFPPEGVTAAFETLRKSYQAIGQPERFDAFIFDGPHKFPLAEKKKRMDWFDRWFKRKGMLCRSINPIPRASRARSSKRLTLL